MSLPTTHIIVRQSQELAHSWQCNFTTYKPK